VEISGRVLGPKGPATNAMVQLQDATTVEWSDNHSTNTDANGNFKLKGVPPGSYTLMAYQETNNVYTPAAKQKLDVGTDNVESVTLVLGRGGDFRGRVAVEGPGTIHLEQLFVILRAVDSAELSSGARVKQDGSFEVKGVEEGSYTLNVDGVENNWYVKSARLGERDILAGGLQVEKGSGGTLEMVISSSSARLDGSVTQEQKPIAGARVRVFPDPENPYNRMRRRSTTTDQTGRFVFSGIFPGKYRVVASSRAPGGGEVTKSDAQLVTLSERGHETVQLTLAPRQSQ
jgi:hypothetical protein